NNLGQISLVKHWSRCLDMVKDEKWIIILGDDDLLGTNCIQDFYNNLIEIERKNISVVRFASLVINEKDEIISNKYNHPIIETSVDFFERKHQGGTRSSLSEYVFKESDFSLKEFPLAWHTDDLAVLECSNYGVVYSINTAYVSFRHSSENITGRVCDLKIKNESSFQFYYYLNKFRRFKFSASQQFLLSKKLNISIINNKSNVSRIFEVNYLYLYQFRIGRIVALQIEILKSLLKKIIYEIFSYCTRFKSFWY
ncbi:MAG: hypothetical protein KBT58_11280, partial [Bizionia sp.]|nr:hypothetical protein [Bizionia sp.]